MNLQYISSNVEDKGIVIRTFKAPFSIVWVRRWQVFLSRWSYVFVLSANGVILNTSKSVHHTLADFCRPMRSRRVSDSVQWIQKTLHRDRSLSGDILQSRLDLKMSCLAWSVNDNVRWSKKISWTATNRPFSKSHGWTGSSMRWRLMRANLFKCNLICPH